MTTENLTVITKYITAKNAENSSDLAACFSDKAIVHDKGEGETHEGLAAIKAWGEGIFQAFKMQTKPISLADEKENVLMKAEVSGNFDGSPLEFTYIFQFDGDRISELIISE